MQITKNHILSVLTSLTYPIGVIVGNFIGVSLTKLLYSIYSLMSFNIIEFITNSISYLVGGLVGGFIAGHIVIKIYKNVHFLSSTILPFIFTLLITFAVLYSWIENLQDISKLITLVANILSFLFYMQIVSEHAKLRIKK